MDIPKCTFRWDSDIIVISKIENSKNTNSYEIRKIYSSERTKVRPIIKYIGTWPQFNQGSTSNYWYNERKSLEGVSLRVSASVIMIYYNCNFLFRENAIVGF